MFHSLCLSRFAHFSLSIAESNNRVPFFDCRTQSVNQGKAVLYPRIANRVFWSSSMLEVNPVLQRFSTWFLGVIQSALYIGWNWCLLDNLDIWVWCLCMLMIDGRWVCWRSSLTFIQVIQLTFNHSTTRNHRSSNLHYLIKYQSSHNLESTSNSRIQLTLATPTLPVWTLRRIVVCRGRTTFSNLESIYKQFGTNQTNQFLTP